MSYKALINSNVKLAFNLLRDLAEPVTLTKKLNSSFDFKTGNPVVTEAPSIVTKAVVTDSDKTSSEHNTATKLALFKTQDIGDISYYDKISYKNQTWSIGPLITSDNFVTVVEFQKEV
jgi:hypothetical protein